MEHGTEDRPRAPQPHAISLGELIHEHVRAAIEHAAREELAAVLGAGRYERREDRYGYRNGHKTRTLTGPSGPLALTMPWLGPPSLFWWLRTPVIGNTARVGEWPAGRLSASSSPTTIWS